MRLSITACSFASNSITIRISEKHVRNCCRIRTYKTRDLKPFRIRTYKKKGGVLLLTRSPTRIAVPRSIATRDLSSDPTKDFYPERSSEVRDLSVQRVINRKSRLLCASLRTHRLCVIFSALCLSAAEWHRLQSVRFNGNKLGSSGGASATASNSGNCTRSGSGTFTFEPFKMLISCNALTTPFP